MVMIVYIYISIYIYIYILYIYIYIYIYYIYIEMYSCTSHLLEKVIVSNRFSPVDENQQLVPRKRWSRWFKS